MISSVQKGLGDWAFPRLTVCVTWTLDTLEEERTLSRCCFPVPSSESLLGFDTARVGFENRGCTEPALRREHAALSEPQAGWPGFSGVSCMAQCPSFSSGFMSDGGTFLHGGCRLGGCRLLPNSGIARAISCIKSRNHALSMQGLSKTYAPCPLRLVLGSTPWKRVTRTAGAAGSGRLYTHACLMLCPPCY